jgi:hypothetical protein
MRQSRLFGALHSGAACLCALALALASGTQSRAGVYSYPNEIARTINCGILLADSAGQNQESSQTGGNDLCAPYPFYILDQRLDVKPVGWHLANPLAPSTVSETISQRFGGAYTIGQQVTPNMGAYWQIDLSAVADGYQNGASNPLSQFSILVIHTHRLMGLSRVEREMLRQYVDQGGLLWFEDCGGATTMYPESGGSDVPDGLFVDALFHDSGSQGFAYTPDNDHRHPLLSTPYFLSNQEINALGDKDVTQYFLSAMESSSLPPDLSSLVSVVGNSADFSSDSSAMPYIAAGDYGSGHIVIDNGDLIDDINNPVTSEGAPYCPTNIEPAHVQDLKFLVNMIAWADNTSSTDAVNDRRDGFQNAPVQGKMDEAWLYPNPATSTATTTSYGTAISGNVVYVTSNDSVGGSTLRAFDLIPQEDIDQSGIADNGYSGTDPSTGVNFLQDFSQGQNYDELWASQLGNGLLSPPAVAAIGSKSSSFYGAQNGYSSSVLVEDASGNVYVYDASSKPSSLTFGSKINGNGGTFTGSVPAPAYYHGWIIAAEPTVSGNPELLLYNTVTNTNATISLSTTGSDPANIDCSPAVASIPSTDGSYGGSDIVCYASTSNNVYSVFLGSRDEQAQTGGSTTEFETKDNSATPVPLAPAPEDGVNDGTNPMFTYLVSTPSWPYVAGDGAPFGPEFRGASFASASPYHLTMDSGTTPSTVYADYDVLPQSGGDYTRHTVASALVGESGAEIVGCCVGTDNNVYVTVNEPNDNAYIECIHEQPPGLNGTSTSIKWRFALQTQPSNLNGDNLNYDFGGSQFIGAPVMDGYNVFAEAYNPTTSIVFLLCFNPSPTIRVYTGQPITQTTSLNATQVDENGTSQTIVSPEYRVIDATNGVLALNDFSSSLGTQPYIEPNLGIPMELTIGTSAYPIATGVSGVPLLRWWMKQPANGMAPGQIRELGNYLYYGDGEVAGVGGIDYGVLGIASVYPPSGGPEYTSSVWNGPNDQTYTTQTLAMAPITEGIAASGSYEVAIGTSASGTTSASVEGLVYGQTLVADNNRLVQIDSNGNATWALDSTAQQAVAGTNAIDADQYNNSADTTTNEDLSATPVESNVALSRPSSLSQLSNNDLLFADTGNSRCVRVDRSGHVIWELTNFNDPNGLLQPGQPTSLNHPTAVIVWTEQGLPTGTGTSLTYTEIDHYLICDAGNFRILEITDTYTYQTGHAVQVIYHVLRGVTHTYDTGGRSYRYVAAQRFTDPTGATYIVAAVSNTQIAPLVTSGTTPELDSASKDGNGSSILFFAYNAANYSTTNLTSTASTFDTGLPVELVNSVVYTNRTYATSTTATVKPLRNLRYMTIYIPPGATSYTQYNVMIADDDGVFDGHFTTAGPTAAGPTPNTDVQPYIDATSTTTAFVFTNADYKTMITSEVGYGDAYPSGLFAASSAQRLPNGHYLITNAASAGDARHWDPASDADNDTQSGGNCFEIDRSGNVYSLLGRNFSASGSPTLTATTGPNNSGPLSQPSFAIEPQ